MFDGNCDEFNRTPQESNYEYLFRMKNAAMCKSNDKLFIQDAHNKFSFILSQVAADSCLLFHRNNSKSQQWIEAIEELVKLYEQELKIDFSFYSLKEAELRMEGIERKVELLGKLAVEMRFGCDSSHELSEELMELHLMIFNREPRAVECLMLLQKISLDVDVAEWISFVHEAQFLPFFDEMKPKILEINNKMQSLSLYLENEKIIQHGIPLF